MRALRNTRTPAILIKCGAPEITYGCAVHASRPIYIKINRLNFNTLNTRIAYQNVLERILIAIHNENTAKSNENFRIGAEEPIAPLYKW